MRSDLAASDPASVFFFAYFGPQDAICIVVSNKPEVDFCCCSVLCVQNNSVLPVDYFEIYGRLSEKP